MMSKDYGGLGLIDVATQGIILANKWVVSHLEGASPLKVLMQYMIIIA